MLIFLIYGYCYRYYYRGIYWMPGQTMHFKIIPFYMVDSFYMYHISNHYIVQLHP